MSEEVIAKEMSERANTVLETVQGVYKKEADAIILPFVQFYTDKFLTPGIQKALFEQLETTNKFSVSDSTVTLKPSVRVQLCSTVDGNESTNVWSDNVIFTLAMNKLDSELKRLSDNTFCLESSKDDKTIHILYQGKVVRIKFFIEE